MSDEKNPYLEPIEEGDLNLEKKFHGGIDDSAKMESVSAPEKESGKETVTAEKDKAYADILSKVKSPASDGELNDEDIEGDAKNAAQQTDAQNQVQHLVDLAMNKGIVHAVKVAKHMEDNYVLDMFHDKMLSEELHKALSEKGLIK